MSSIRLYILGSLEEHGPQHGHQLRMLAEQEHIDQWTDFTVGAVYGAIKRLAVEGLIADVRTEREGSYPERQIYRITDAGSDALATIRRDALRGIVFRPDPFDLAVTRLDPTTLDGLGDEVENRLQTLEAMLAETERQAAHADQYLTVAERVVMTHKTARLRAEITWHEQLLEAVPEIVTDESSRKDAR